MTGSLDDTSRNNKMKMSDFVIYSYHSHGRADFFVSYRLQFPLGEVACLCFLCREVWAFLTTSGKLQGI